MSNQTQERLTATILYSGLHEPLRWDIIAPPGTHLPDYLVSGMQIVVMLDGDIGEVDGRIYADAETEFHIVKKFSGPGRCLYYLQWVAMPGQRLNTACLQKDQKLYRTWLPFTGNPVILYQRANFKYPSPSDEPMSERERYLRSCRVN